MKKIFLPFLFTFLLGYLPFSFAKEETPPLAPGPLQEKPVASLPFEFSLTQGAWAEAKPGAIFTSGTHAADFLLPSLKEEPVPIRYPRWAIREGWEGTFVIAIEVLQSGQVGRWKVIESTGYPLLDQAATEAVRQWRFHPAREGGKPIVSCIQIPIHFTLKDEDPGKFRLTGD